MIAAPGRRFGPYELIALLGAGGMGEVFRARDTRLGRDVAVKVLPAAFSADSHRLRRFEQEARVVAALNHPAILAIYDVGTENGVPYLVTELLQGEPLVEQLMRGPVPVRKAVDYATQIAHGLAAAHEKGIVHRDLKPENLFVTHDGRVKILDFGLAKLTQPQDEIDTGKTHTSVSLPGVVLGTEGYMSPEQVRGLATDHQSDIFSFGTVLYEMLTGRRAFKRQTSADTMTAILREDVPDITETVPQVPPGLQRVVQHCLEKKPEQRFRSASDLAFALEALSYSSSSPASTVTSAPYRGKGHRWVQWSVALAVVIAIGSLLWWKIPTAVPELESVAQLTDDGVQKSTDSSLATDGSRVYFNEGETNNWRIAQVSVTGGQTAPLMVRVRDPQIVSIAPDTSALLALERAVEVGAAYPVPIWVLPLPVGEPRRVGELKAEDAAFFPDSKHVAYANGNSLYIAEKDGTNSRRLAEFPASVGSPEVSPDGRRVRLTLWGKNGSGTLWEIAADGSGAHQLLKGWHDPPVECCGKWTPDGRYFVFQSWSDVGWELWVWRDENGFFHRSASAPVRLTNGPLSYNLPLPSRDGRKVFAVGTKRRGELVRYDKTAQQFMPYLDGISATDVTSSRDGAWITWLTYPDHVLWRSRPDGSDRLQLNFAPLVASYPRVSPDGNSVLFDGFSRTEGFSQYVTSMQGGTPRKIADGLGSAAWSPDGHFVVLTTLVSGAQIGSPDALEIRTVDLQSGKITLIADSRGKIGPFWPTPDTLIAATEDLSKFVVFDFKTGKWSDFSRGPATNWLLSWDRKYLYCDRTNASGHTVVRIHLPDGHEETVADFKGLRRVVDQDFGTWLGIAPDGSVLLTRDIGTQEIYALNVKWP